MEKLVKYGEKLGSYFRRLMGEAFRQRAGC